jgi:hypothetical protein
MATPTLKRSWGFVGASSNNAGRGNNFTMDLEASGTPCAVVSGDLIIVSVAYPVALTATISDDGSNTYTQGLSVSDANRKYEIYFTSATAFASRITVGLGANTSDVECHCHIFYNCATASILDGAGSSNTAVTGPNVLPGAITTTVDGDLIYNIAFNTDFPLGQASTITAIAFGTGMTGLFAEQIAYGQAAQYQVQTTHGSTFNPQLTFTQSSHDVFASLALAFKAGTGGAAPSPSSSPYILRSQLQYANNITSTYTIPFPTTGSLTVALNEAGTIGDSLTNVTDSNSNTWHEEAGHPATFPQVWYTNNPTVGLATTVSFTLSGVNSTLIALYDVVNGGALDTGATAANASVLTTAGSGATKNLNSVGAGPTTIADATSIVPSVSGGIIFAGNNIGTGPIGTLTAPSGARFDCVGGTWSTGGDAQAFSNGDAIGHYFVPSTGTKNFTWNYAGPGASWQALAISFLAAPPQTIVGQPDEDYWSVTILQPSVTNVRLFS